MVEAITLDCVAIARHSWNLGWRPEHRFGPEASQVYREFQESLKGA
jgi:hypothetical protein